MTEDKLFTVYFDTSFFIELALANKELALFTINELNKLHLRHVVSDVIIRELLVRSNLAERDAILVHRVRQFEVDPYLTNPAWIWDDLLIKGNNRYRLSTIQKQFDDASTIAGVLGTLSRRQETPERNAALRNAIRSISEKLGLSINLTDANEQVYELMKFACRTAGLDTSDLPPFPSSFEPESIAEFEEGMMQFVGEDKLRRATEEEVIQDSVVGSDPRIVNVAHGTASLKEEQRLKSEFRDCKHMLEFELHHDQIDLLQLDIRQFNRMMRSSPSHRFKKNGLDRRCFSAGTLPEVIDEMKRLKGSQ
jgi:hypothetical protein